MNTNSQIQDNMTQAFETAHSFFQFSLENTAKITNVFLETSKNMLDDTVIILKNITQISNPQQVLAHINQLTTKTLKNTRNYKDIRELVVFTQNHINKMFKMRTQDFKINQTNNVTTSHTSTTSDLVRNNLKFSTQIIKNAAAAAKKNIAKKPHAPVTPSFKLGYGMGY